MDEQPSNVSELSLSKQFEYIKLCRDIDTLENINDVKDLCKKFLLMYINSQHITAQLAKWDFKLNNPDT